VRRARVLIVDDSTFVRRTLRRVFTAEPDLEVIGEAGDGREALERVRELRPDLVTLDLQMPGMDGMTALRELKETWPHLPVLVFASAAHDRGAVVFEALALGAFDFVDKSRCTAMDLHLLGAELCATARAALAHRLGRASGVRRAVLASAPGPALPDGATVLCIGASTGGPESIRALLDALPAAFPCAVGVVQHMPIGFTAAFAERLALSAALEVKEAAEGDEVRRGRVLVAPAGLHLGFRRTHGGTVLAALSPGEPDALHVPSVDALFASAAEVFGPDAIGVVLSGMGSDGREGARRLAAAGAFLIAEAEESCAVYGMPRALVEARLANAVWPLPEIRARLAAYSSRSSSSSEEKK
jgi:two-component system, chemotaxis family, protein-glutamate methylesterase/glutaminase